MNLTRASDRQIDDFLKANNAWSLVDGKLHKEFVFADFRRAFAFMTVVAEYAELSNHHPEWFNVYRKVTVDLTTHEVEGVSDRDFRMAEKMDAIEHSMVK